MKLPVLIAMILNTTFVYPRRTVAPAFRALPATGTAIPLPGLTSSCSFLGAGGAEGLLMPMGEMVTTYCRGLPSGTNLNTSFIVTKTSYDADAGDFTTTPTSFQSNAVLSGISLRWTQKDGEGWALIGGSSDGSAPAGNGGGNSLYYIQSVSDPASPFQLVHNGSSYVFQDVQVTDLGLFILAQQIGMGSGTSLVRSGLLWWTVETLPRERSVPQ